MKASLTMVTSILLKPSSAKRSARGCCTGSSAQVSVFSLAVYHGVGKVYHGVEKVYHGVGKVYHGVGKDPSYFIIFGTFEQIYNFCMTNN